jgi:hypothetical protein
VTKSTESENHGDRGTIFGKVDLYLPSEDLLDNLIPEIRQIVSMNIERARFIFRAHTLPLLGESARLCPLYSTGLNYLIERALFNGISPKDESVLYPSPDFRGNTNFVRFRLVATNEEPSMDCVYTADLLGKYWYRDQDNQPLDYFEGLAEALEIRELTKDGKPIPDDFYTKTKPPTSSRRKI